MDSSFPEVKKYFGFGCMRLPMKDGNVDLPQFEDMVDLFLENGFIILIRHMVIWMVNPNWPFTMD